MNDSAPDIGFFGAYCKLRSAPERSGPESFATLHNIYEYIRCQPMRFGRVSGAMMIRFGKVIRPMRIGSNRLAMIQGLLINWFGAELPVGHEEELLALDADVAQYVRVRRQQRRRSPPALGIPLQPAPGRAERQGLEHLTGELCAAIPVVGSMFSMSACGTKPKFTGYHG